MLSRSLATLKLYLVCPRTCRYFFLEFSTPEEAVNAVKTGNGYRLDKSHIFKVNFFSDFEKCVSLRLCFAVDAKLCSVPLPPPGTRIFLRIGNHLEELNSRRL